MGSPGGFGCGEGRLGEGREGRLLDFWLDEILELSPWLGERELIQLDLVPEDRASERL